MSADDSLASPSIPDVHRRRSRARAPLGGLRQAAFWNRVLVGRFGIALGLSCVLSVTPDFGPRRGLIAVMLIAGSAVQTAMLHRLVRRDGYLPRICSATDLVFVGIAGAVFPVTFVWGLIVMAVTMPITVICYGRRFATLLLVAFTPVYLVIALVEQPPQWVSGFSIFTVAGLGSCTLVGYAAEEERKVRDRFGDILDQLQVVVFESPGIGQQLSYVNDHVGNLIGFQRVDWLQPSWWESRVHPDDHHIWLDSNRQSIEGISHQSTYRMIAEDGRVLHILEITKVLDAGQGRTKIRGVLVDVTRQRVAEAEASHLAKLVDQIPIALQILEVGDPDDLASIRVVDANRRACDSAGLTLAELVNRSPLEQARLHGGEGDLAAMAAVRRTGTAVEGMERQWTDEQGNTRRMSVGAFGLGGDYVGVSYEDITDRSDAERALRYQANHDALTGLPNRVMLAARLDAALSKCAEPDSDASGALLVMDLDQFKEVNDALGHHHGDRLLVELSRRLMEIAADEHLIARLGGDEFAMLIEGGTTRRAYEIAHLIGDRFAEPIVIDGVSLQSNVSVGIALYPEHADERDGLMQRADVAMYRAKHGGTGVTLYTPEQSNTGIRRLQLLGDLRQAISAGELTLHYQPRVQLASGELEGLEALVRWEHPTLGMLPPDEFIALAEVSGLIQDLTTWVIRQAVADNARFREVGHTLPVAVNLSVRNLYSPDLVENILSSLAEFDLPAELLRVELTESEIMDDPAIAMQVLQRLREVGIEVSIDDFGTGYSSLSYLRDLPFDEIKIDRSFVAAISGGDDVVVRSIIDLGHALGVAVVGEGVETIHQWVHLTRLGCDVAQGYLISRPLPFEALLRFLDDRRDFSVPMPVETTAEEAPTGLGAPVTRG